jgi:Cdc6-like AAA superfamily ATPase
MKVSDAKRFIKNVAKEQVPVTIAMVGSSGIGKSAIVKQVAKELEVGYIDLRLATQEPGDLIGIPYREDNVTHNAMPSWFPKEGTKGILCLEELNRAPNDVRQAIFQLIWDRVMHQTALPVGWSIILAMNPDNGEYQVETLDKALVRRCSVITVEPSVNDWMEWAVGEGQVPSKITGFIGTHKDMLFESENFDFPVTRTCAGWGETLTLLDKAKVIPPDLEFEIVAGITGKEAATAYMSYLAKNYERPVSGEEVLKDYSKVKEKVLKQRNKSDETYVTIKQIVGICDTLKKLDKKQQKNLIEFILDLTADMQAMIAHNLSSEILSALVDFDDRILVIGQKSKEVKEDK